MSKFYTLRQNNSGGYFEEDDYAGICEYVIIEAESVKEATSKAEEITSEFNNYCPCCGERWYTWFDERDGKDTPKIYDSIVEECEQDIVRNRAFVHYLDGTIKEFKFK